MAGRRYSRKSGMKKSKKSSKMFSKAVKQEIKAISYKTQETKSINVPDATTPLTNTVGLIYPSASGIQYLVFDAFKCNRGTDDGTQIGAANRVGDSVYALGLQMKYTFMSFVNIVNPLLTTLPFVRLRIILFVANSSVAPPPGTALLLDSNYVGTGSFTSSTMQPINYRGGMVKRVLYDKVKILRAANQTINAAPPIPYEQSQVYNFDKYIKLKHKVKYTSLAGEPTDEPINLCIIAEVDNTSANIASGSRLIRTVGYCRAFFKDG